MTPEQREEAIRLLQQGEDLSPEWARILFPPEKREYELVYHGKEREEDILADTLSTRERPTISCSAAELRRGDKTAFIPPECDKTIPDEQLEFFKEVEDEDGDFLAGRVLIDNAHDFKTPCNLAIADATPERKFIRELCKRPNASVLDAWLKSAPQRYYAIEYAWKKGEHPKRGEFSPDFFIKKGDMVHVVEIKDDSEIADPSTENLKKFEYAQAHFERINKWLGDAGMTTRYQHNWLSPKSYNRFFQLLREGAAEGFRSELDVSLNAAATSGRAERPTG